MSASIARSLAALTAAISLASPPASAQDVEPPSGFPTAAPSTGPAPGVDVPRSEIRTLENGLRVIYVTRSALPIVHAALVTRGGGGDAPADAPELPSFTADLLDEGAGGRSALDLAAETEALGASLSVRSSWDAVTVDMEVLRPHLVDALGLMADVVVRPDFPDEEVERKREERLTELARARDEARVIAGNALVSLIYGPDHPYGRLATTEVTGAIRREQMKAFHDTFYRPNVSTLILVGDVGPDRYHSVVDAIFGRWERQDVPDDDAVAAPEPEPTRIYLVDRPGAPQSEIRIGHPGVARGDPEYFPITVMNTILGASFTSRLNSNLREAHGYTYGAGSGYAMRKSAGPFQAGAAVVSEKTDSALVEFFRELERIRAEPVPADELDRARNYVALGYPRRFETTGGTAGQIADVTTYGLGTEWFTQYVPRTLAVSGEQVLRAAHDHVWPERAVVVIVGDLASVGPAVRALGIAPVEVRDAAEFVR